MTDSQPSRSSLARAALTFRQTTAGIDVAVSPSFLEHQSNPGEKLFVWSYEIEISNQGPKPVQLLARHWRIYSAHGQLIEVKGAGVVGDQPRLKPGASYSYTSYTHLPTPSGLMVGTYSMQEDDGEAFDVAIPPFSLDSPAQVAMPN